MVDIDYERHRLTEKSYKIIELITKAWTHPGSPDNDSIIDKVAEELFYANIVHHTKVCNYCLNRRIIFECLWLDTRHVVGTFVSHEFHKDDTEYLNTDCLDHINRLNSLLEKYFGYLAEVLSSNGVAEIDDLIIQLRFFLGRYS